MWIAGISVMQQISRSSEHSQVGKFWRPTGGRYSDELESSTKVLPAPRDITVATWHSAIKTF